MAKDFGSRTLAQAKATPEWQAFPYKARRTLELIALRYLTPDRGCIASPETISKVAGVHRATVIRHLNLAVERGILTKRRRTQEEFGIVGASGEPWRGDATSEYRFVVNSVQQSATPFATPFATPIATLSTSYKTTATQKTSHPQGDKTLNADDEVGVAASSFESGFPSEPASVEDLYAYADFETDLSVSQKADCPPSVSTEQNQRGGRRQRDGNDGLTYEEYRREYERLVQPQPFPPFEVHT